MNLVNYIKTNKYLISSLLFSFIFLFPIMRNAVQSISLIVFILASVAFYYKTFLKRIKNRHIWKTYIMLTGFFWFSVFSFLWTEDKVFFLNEVRPSISIALIPFIILFFHPPFTPKSKNLAILFFLVSLIIYSFLWFFHHIEGISIYQEIIAKESPVRDQSILEQLGYLKNKSYKLWVGGVSDRGYELLGKNSFFSHSNYISSYYVFGFVLGVYALVKAESRFYSIVSIITIVLSGVFLFYLQSKLNVLLFVLVALLLIFHFLRTRVRQGIFALLLVVIGLLNLTKIENKVNELRNWDIFEKNDNNMDKDILLDYKRTKIYSCALKELNKSYMFGLGLGDIQGYLNNCLISENRDNPNFDIKKEYNSHSQFFHYALVGGVINIFLFFVFFTFLFFKAYKQKNKLLFFFVLLAFVSCLFENYLSRIYGVLFVFLFIMLLPNWEELQIKSKKAE